MKTHEQLQIHDKMQKEFINIAAHELCTPIQSILGLSGIVHCAHFLLSYQPYHYLLLVYPLLSKKNLL
jgi:signal transduction histidine kinase